MQKPKDPNFVVETHMDGVSDILKGYCPSFLDERKLGISNPSASEALRVAYDEASAFLKGESHVKNPGYILTQDLHGLCLDASVGRVDQKWFEYALQHYPGI